MLHNIETFERAANLKQAAFQRGDEDMIRTISEEDLIAKDAVYHSTCLSSYLSKTNLKVKALCQLLPHSVLKTLPFTV